MKEEKEEDGKRGETDEELIDISVAPSSVCKKLPAFLN